LSEETHSNTRPTVLKGGKLIDGTGNPPLKDAVVIFENSRIKAVGGEDTKIPSDAEVIDCSDKTIMPGLIDAHVHLAAIRSPEAQRNWPLARVKTTTPLITLHAACNARRMLESGFTSCRDMAGPCSSDRNLEILALREAINLGIMAGPRLVVSGWVVRTGDEPDLWLLLTIPRMPEYVDIPVSRPVDGIQQIRKRIREQIKWGCDVIKIECSPRITTEELNAMSDEAHLWGKRFAVHAITAEETKKAIHANADTIEHGTILDDEAIEMMIKRGVFLVTTMTVYSEKSQERYKAMGVGQSFIESLKVEGEAYAKSVRKAHEAGVKIVGGTDCSRNLLHGDNAIELELMVECGMSEMEAIVASTKTAAEAIGLNETGTLENGKLADIIVVDGDPLKDIKILQDRKKILVVIKDGNIQLRRDMRASW